MTTLRIQNNLYIVLSITIVLLIDLCRTAPTLTSQNLTEHLNIESLTRESSVTLSSLTEDYKINLTLADFPRFNRNSTKPNQKSKKLTKNLNAKKIKEKNLKYSLDNLPKHQIVNNFVKNTSETSILTTQDETIINRNGSQILKPIRIPVTTLSPLTTTTTTHLTTAKFEDVSTTHFIPIQITSTSTTEKQQKFDFLTSTTKQMELTPSTEIVTPIKNNSQILLADKNKSSIPLTMNINRLKGQNKTEEVLFVNSSIVGKEIEKNDFILSPTVNIFNLTTEEPIQTTITSVPTGTTSPSTVLSDLNFSENPITKLSTEEYSTISIESTTNNNIMITDTLKLNITQDAIHLDSLTDNSSTFLNTLSDNIQHNIESSTITNNKNLINNITGMGHDGIKITKKKQLVENHYIVIESSTELNSPTIMNEEILTDTTTEQNDIDNKNIVSTTDNDVISVTPEYNDELITTVEDEIGTTNLLDVDLMSDNLQLDTITEIPIIMTTENEIIKHKNFEKSLITKMEWIPIENIDHTKMNTKDLLTTEMNVDQTTPELLSTNTEFFPLTKENIESGPKSLEIELIDTPKLPDKVVKSVPEFFEIATSKQHQNNNNEKESESAPIEIQINVSEGFGNETENLEFSFRQPPQKLKQKHIAHQPPPGFQEIGEITIQRTPDLNTLQPIPILNEKNDEILQVEITAIDNTTKTDDKQSDNFNEAPKFTVHNEQNLEMRENDDIFVPDLTMDVVEDTIPSKNIENSERDAVDQDADTIFYISNTEVKVGESVPNFNSTNREHNSNRKIISQDSNRSKLESQFFPAIYEEEVIIDTPGDAAPKLNQTKLNLNSYKKPKYRPEDIISPSRQKNFKYQKINRNHEEIILNSAEKSYKSPAALAAAAAPDVSYVGETFIEIEESTNIPIFEDNKKFGDSYTVKPVTKKDTDTPIIMVDADMNSSGALLSDVIIQPAVVPEMSIGVPVIGELPPQIELKEIDFLPANNVKENHEKMIDGGSIQYGADVIADEAEINDNPNRYIFESGYPFTDEKISRVGRIRNNDENEMLVRDENDDDSDDLITNSQQIIMHAVNNLQRDQLIADTSSDNWDGYKEKPIKRNNDKTVVNENSTNYMNNSSNFLNSTGGNATELLGNATAFSVIEDNEGTDFNLADIQTLIIACFATLIPLILSLLTAFGVRYLWIKYRRDHDEGSGLVGDSSTDPLASKSVAISRDELQTTESGYTLNHSNDTLESNINITSRTSGTIIDGVVNGGNDGISQYTNGLGNIITVSTTNQQNGNTANNLSNHIGANGSVTTMTLKNNHLIVETEERNDISRDARETKMHYTSSEKDGVFVVEVARGADSTGAPGSPNNNLINHQKTYNMDVELVDETKTKKPLLDECNHEEVQIHQPPADTDTLIEVDEPIGSPTNTDNYNVCHNLANSNTGLSQSDLSSSSDDSNKAYSYGKQELYTIPTNGYSPSSTQPKITTPQRLENGDVKKDKSPESETKENNNYVSNKDNSESKPIITAALLKQDTLNELTSVVTPKQNVENSKTTEPEQYIIELNGTDRSVTKPISDPDGNNKMIQNEEENRIISKNFQHSDDKITDLNLKNIQTNPTDNYENLTINGKKENCENENEEIETTIENCINGENGFDSIISLPEPPSTEEIKQMNDIILMDNSQLDSLPPPPPPLTECQNPTITFNTNGNTNKNFNNNISPIPESIIEDEKQLETEDCDENTILTTLSTTTMDEQHSINELQNGIGGGGKVLPSPLAVIGSS